MSDNAWEFDKPDPRIAICDECLLAVFLDEDEWVNVDGGVLHQGCVK